MNVSAKGTRGGASHQHLCVHNQQDFPSAKPHCIRPLTTVPSTPSRLFNGAFTSTRRGSSTWTRVDVTSSLFQQPQPWFRNYPVGLSVADPERGRSMWADSGCAYAGYRSSPGSRQPEGFPETATDSWGSCSFTAGWNPFRWKLHLVSSGSVDSDPRTHSSLPTQSLLNRAPWFLSN